MDVFSYISSWNTVIILSIVNTFFIFFYVRFNKYNIISVSNFFLLSLWLCFFFGFILSYFYHFYVNDVVLVEKIFYAQILISLCLYIYLFVFFIIDYLLPKFRIKLFEIPNQRSFIKLLSVILFLSSIFSIVFYVFKNDGFILLKSTSYVDRYQSNMGLGFVTLLINMYIPALVIYYLLKPSKSRLFFALFLSISIGILSYLAIGGYRQILFMGILSLLFYNLYHQGISFLRFIFYSFIGVFVLFYLALLRYNIELDENMLVLLIGFSIDSLSPFKSFINIFEYIDATKDYQNLKLFFGHFQIVIPRVLWTDKPELILNSGNFYTQNILNYKSALTISPTIAGELYLMRGFFSLVLGFAFLAIINVFLERVLTYCKDNSYIAILHNTFFFVCLFNVFWLVREGLEVYIYRTLRMYILFWFFIIITYVVYVFLTYKKTTK